MGLLLGIELRMGAKGKKMMRWCGNQRWSRQLSLRDGRDSLGELNRGMNPHG